MSNTKYMDFMYEFILRGYEVVVLPSDKGENFLYVSVAQNGKPIYEMDVPMDFEREDILLYDDEYTYAADAAIDFFEASNGILGQGAGAEIKAMKKEAFYPVEDFEDWYMSFKGTPFEDDAYLLLSQLIEYQYLQDNYEKRNLEERKKEIKKELNKLDLERMKNQPKSDLTITVKTSSINKVSFLDSTAIESYLNRFEGCELESQAVCLIKDYLEVVKKLNEVEKSDKVIWDMSDSVYDQMDELSMKKLEWETMDSIQLGVEVSDFEKDMTSLMDMVDLSDFM